MVEDSKKRGRGQRAGGGSTPAGKGRLQHGAGVAAADQDAFAAFTSKYRDMLRFADADEAEAVYSMVSLTQAAHRQQGEWQHSQPADIKGPVIEVPESRAVKRRPVPLAVPASSACSEGGRSDSSAKSAPGPPPYMHQWQHTMQPQHESMLAAALGPPGTRQAGAAHHQQQQTQAVDGPVSAGPAGDIHPGALGPISMGMSRPMAPPFFPPGCMPGMMMGGPPGCPPAPCMPFMPPWAMNPAMMQSMQSMMFAGGLPMPPLPMPPPGMMLPMPFMPGMAPMPGMVGPAAEPAAAEPAAGIPVSGPLPPAGNAFRAAGIGPASKGSAGTAAASKQTPAPAVQPAQAAPSTPAAAAAATTQLRPASQQQRPVAAMQRAGTASGSAGDVLPELEQLDVVALRPWVVSHFCEDVYLLLLDVWRPDSAKVREAIWAWKLHVKAPRPAGAQPDYRAFLVSLFGLDKLTQLSAAAQAARQGSSTLTKGASSPVAPTVVPAHSLQAPAAAQEAPCVAAAVKAAAEDCALRLASAAGVCEGMTPEHEAPSAADCEAAVTTSNLSSEPGAALTAPGPHVMNILVPGSTAGGGASATSPHRARLELQQQEQLA